jgi:hypothetical protein
MKLLIRLFGALLVLLVGALIVFAIYFDSLVGGAIERGGTYALGVDTKVGAALLRPLAGSLDIRRLRIANPPGFEADHFLAMRRGRFHVRIASLREDTIRVPLLALDGIDVVLENNKGQTNTDAILKNASRFEKGKASPAEKPADGKKVIVKELVITDITAQVDIVDPVAGLARFDDVTVTIPEIRLRNIGSENAGGVAMSELVDIIVKAVLTAVAKHGTALPGVIAGQLRTGLGGVSQVPVEIVAGTLEKSLGAALGEEAAAPVGEVTRGAGKLLGDQADKALKGLFGTKKEE